jgi:uncharacterized protein YggU (UPF0235/DUF167 family)
VKANASSFSALIKEGVLVARVPAKPVEGKANKALLQGLKRLGLKARLVSGVRSREKEIELDASMEEVKEKLR